MELFFFWKFEVLKKILFCKFQFWTFFGKSLFLLWKITIFGIKFEKIQFNPSWSGLELLVELYGILVASLESFSIKTFRELDATFIPFIHRLSTFLGTFSNIFKLSKIPKAEFLQKLGWVFLALDLSYLSYLSFFHFGPEFFFTQLWEGLMYDFQVLFITF